jgi:hypothetical protein
VKLRDLEVKGDLSRDKKDLLGAGELEETESRLELEVMLFHGAHAAAARVQCGEWQAVCSRDLTNLPMRRMMRSNVAQLGLEPRLELGQAWWRGSKASEGCACNGMGGYRAVRGGTSVAQPNRGAYWGRRSDRMGRLGKAR